jgi:hypothetical protein
MARELGGSQISALLESVPGIVNVLRSPVADALVGMIRAGAGLDEFRLEHSKELVQYAVRRGLISGAEGDHLLEEVSAVAKKGTRRKGGATKAAGSPRKAGAKKKPARKASKKTTKKPAKKAAKKKATRSKRR